METITQTTNPQKEGQPDSVQANGTKVNSVQSNSAQPATSDWRELRRQERAQRRRARRAWRAEHGSGWGVGIVLILLGGIFLLQNIGIFYVQNWWALFLLIPAAGSFMTAWAVYRGGGRLSAPARGALISGIILVCLSLTFLLNLDFGLLWPLFLILGGVALLGGALWGD